MLNMFNNVWSAVNNLLGLDDEEPSVPSVQAAPEDYVVIEMSSIGDEQQDLDELLFLGQPVQATWFEMYVDMANELRNPAPLRGPEHRAPSSVARPGCPGQRN